LEKNERVRISLFSVVSVLASAIGVVLYSLCFSTHSVAVFTLFKVVAIVSIIIPPVSKAQRLSVHKSGKALEILSIIIAGFNFYCVIFAFTKLPILIAYLGWVICGVTYKLAKGSWWPQKEKCLSFDESVPVVLSCKEPSAQDNAVGALEITDTMPETRDNDDLVFADQKPCYCRKCGAKLGDDVLFCHRCGAKVIGG